jgi:hypothetical protein
MLCSIYQAGCYAVLNKNKMKAGNWCLTPIILATWEAEIARIAIQGQPEQMFIRSPLQNNQSKNGPEV